MFDILKRILQNARAKPAVTIFNIQNQVVVMSVTLYKIGHKNKTVGTKHTDGKNGARAIYLPLACPVFNFHCDLI